MIGNVLLHQTILSCFNSWTTILYIFCYKLPNVLFHPQGFSTSCQLFETWLGMVLKVLVYVEKSALCTDQSRAHTVSKFRPILMYTFVKYISALPTTVLGTYVFGSLHLYKKGCLQWLASRPVLCTARRGGGGREGEGVLVQYDLICMAA